MLRIYWFQRCFLQALRALATAKFKERTLSLLSHRKHCGAEFPSSIFTCLKGSSINCQSCFKHITYKNDKCALCRADFALTIGNRPLKRSNSNLNFHIEFPCYRSLILDFRYLIYFIYFLWNCWEVKKWSLRSKEMFLKSRKRQREIQREIIKIPRPSKCFCMNMIYLYFIQKDWLIINFQFFTPGIASRRKGRRPTAVLKFLYFSILLALGTLILIPLLFRTNPKIIYFNDCKGEV